MQWDEIGMKHGASASDNLHRKAAWLSLACAVAALTMMPATGASGQSTVLSAGEYSVYLPQVVQPFQVFFPLYGLDPSTGFVTRQGEDLILYGQPYTFVGVNVSYLAGPFFPEAKMEGVISFLAVSGVDVIRVWVEPWCDLDRVERMLDLGRSHNIRFILTLQDFYGEQSGHWFREGFLTKDLPHIQNIVPRFVHRPEVLMWELMNEPACPAGDSGKDCWDALYRWAQVTSREVKRLDPNHLVSAGTQGAGFDELAMDAFRRIHALDSIDVVSVHGQGGKLDEGERKKEIAIAHELGKPLYFGEIAIRGHDESCQALSSEALKMRAQAIDVDMQLSIELGVDGYLLWQYAYGGVDLGSHVQYFCGAFDYFADDPVWKVLKARE
jgi:hypothetical protein